ncbi:little elongation complex subunit 2 [Teleopsis dalmanni]|uniref:little elongation complex subunit 2 n=1 Tax=Teleopsis dalmanni TaxID=139649 RepID=UPI0018CEDF80|nr:little elongation complex subunit 2 [Teleopsis dalmanni]
MEAPLSKVQYGHHYRLNTEDFSNPMVLIVNELNKKVVKTGDVMIGFRYHQMVDPRTQRIIVKHMSDSSKGYFKSALDRAPTLCSMRSTLDRSKHALCYRVAKALQDNTPIEEDDYKTYLALQPIIKKEQIIFNKCIKEYSTIFNIDIYQPMEYLVLICKKWYEHKIQLFRQKYPQNLALDNTRKFLFKINDYVKVQIEQITMLEQEGCIRLWSSGKESMFRNIYSKLDFLIDWHKNLNEKTKILPEEIEKHVYQQLHIEKDHNKFFLPFDALVMLMSSDDYIDLPNKVIFDVKSYTNSQFKVVLFEEPFPSHHLGLHTYNEIVEIGYNSFIKRNCQQWLPIKNMEIGSVFQDKCSPTYLNTGKSEQPYQLRGFNEYMEKYFCVHKTGQIKYTSNSTLIKFHLKEKDYIKLFTTFEMAGVVNEKATEFIGGHSIKLEHKPLIGCELMTSYELIKEWIKLRFMQELKRSTHSICSRLSSENFLPQLEERLTLQKIEQQLESDYNISIEKRLSDLNILLKKIANLELGKYCLIQKDTKETFEVISLSNDLEIGDKHIYDLFEPVPHNFRFMVDPISLPISQNLIGKVHENSKILPCMFLPKLPKKVMEKKNLKVYTHFKPLQEATRHSYKRKSPNAINSNKLSASNKLKKNARKRQKRKQKQDPHAPEKKLKTNEERELEDDIKNYETIFGS